MSLTKNLEFEKTSFLTKTNSAFIEQMYLRYINNDPELPESWRGYFQELGEEIDIIANELKGPTWSPIRKEIIIDPQISEPKEEEVDDNKSVGSKNQIQNNIDSIKAVELIRAYRLRGHLLAKLDPLGLKETEYLEELHPEFYGFKKKWLQTKHLSKRSN